MCGIPTTDQWSSLWIHAFVIAMLQSQLTFTYIHACSSVLRCENEACITTIVNLKCTCYYVTHMYNVLRTFVYPAYYAMLFADRCTISNVAFKYKTIYKKSHNIACLPIRYSYVTKLQVFIVLCGWSSLLCHRSDNPRLSRRITFTKGIQNYKS